MRVVENESNKIGESFTYSTPTSGYFVGKDKEIQAPYNPVDNELRSKIIAKKALKTEKLRKDEHSVIRDYQKIRASKPVEALDKGPQGIPIADNKALKIDQWKKKFYSAMSKLKFFFDDQVQKTPQQLVSKAQMSSLMHPNFFHGVAEPPLEKMTGSFFDWDYFILLLMARFEKNRAILKQNTVNLKVSSQRRLELNIRK